MRDGLISISSFYFLLLSLLRIPYNEKSSLWNKIETIAKEIYKASKITADEKVKDELKKFEIIFSRFFACLDNFFCA